MGEREMSQNKSLQSKMPLAMGLAFVADPAGSDTGIVCIVFLVWNALCL